MALNRDMPAADSSHQRIPHRSALYEDDLVGYLQRKPLTGAYHFAVRCIGLGLERTEFAVQ